MPEIEPIIQPSIDRAWQWAVNTCNEDNVGYSMDTADRGGVKVNGITYYDCSSFIYFALQAGNFPVSSWVFNTSYMLEWLPANGFHQIDPTGEWKPGDILLDPDSGAHGHTEMVYQGGIGQGVTMGAHQAGVALPDQVSINNGATVYEPNWRYWGGIWRYGEGGTGSGITASMYVISAILGNWYRESTINPSAYEGWIPYDIYNPYVYGGYGLGQWTNTVRADGTVGTHRRTDLLSWLSANGYEKNDPYGQMNYLIKSKEWIPKEPYKSVFPDWDSFINSKSTNIDLLCDVYFNCWEGGGTDSGPIRKAHAHEVFEYLLEHHADTGLEWHMEERANTTEELLENAVLVYQYLSIYAGGGTGGYNYHKGMPVWMMIRRWK